LKATEGKTYTDPTFASHYTKAQEAGVPVGAYHYARPDHNTAKAEAEHFLNVLKLTHGDLKPVLDFETKGSPLDESWARAFNKIVYAHTHVWPLFYSYSYFIHNLNASFPIGGGLWLADYGKNDGKEHSYTTPFPWKKTLVHQYTSNGIVRGVSGRVDLSKAVSLKAISV